MAKSEEQRVAEFLKQAEQTLEDAIASLDGRIEGILDRRAIPRELVDGPTDEDLAARRERRREQLAETAEDLRESLTPFLDEWRRDMRVRSIAEVGARLFTASGDAKSAVAAAVKLLDESERVVTAGVPAKA